MSVALNGYVGAIHEVLSVRQNKVLVLMVGVSGAGKSHFLDALQHALFQRAPPLTPQDVQIFSLDDYRCRVNNGVYPQGDRAHAAVNREAVPLYNRDVYRAQPRLMILDNTHLRWSPNWELPLRKATEQQYHLLTVAPPFTRYALSESRSTHGVSSADFVRRMIMNWPGHRFGHFLYRMVRPQDVPLIQPKKPDLSFSRIMVERWGPPSRGAYLYQMNNYIGFVDSAMGAAAMAAAHVMAAAGSGPHFMHKDGPLHFTLVIARTREQTGAIRLLKEVVRALLDQPPPPVTYTGVHCLKEGENQTWFMTVSGATQSAWKERVDAACQAVGFPGRLNEGGLHVTLGYQHRDIHDVDKAIAPHFPFAEPLMTDGAFWRQPDAPFLPAYQGLFTPPKMPLSAWRAEEKPSQEQKVVDEYLQAKLGVTFTTTSISKAQYGHLYYLVRHARLSSKLRVVPEGIHGQSNLAMYLLAFRIKKRHEEDVAYRSEPELCAKLPRGLCFLFSLPVPSRRLTLQHIVYPTSKFFRDDEREVPLVTERLKYWVATEKANGEMCSLSVTGSDAQKYDLVIGTKNNKFLFCFHDDPSSSVADHLARTRAQIDLYKAAENSIMQEGGLFDLWQEIALYTVRRLAEMDRRHRNTFLSMLAERQWTASGEFESAAHPHLVHFPSDHTAIKFFALTAAHADGRPQQITAQERLEQLRHLTLLGLETVAVEAVSTDVEAFRRHVLQQRHSEGVVLLIDGDSGCEMMKMKTDWYVMWRLFRDRLAPLMQSAQSMSVRGTVVGCRQRIVNGIQERAAGRPTVEAYWLEMLNVLLSTLQEKHAVHYEQLRQQYERAFPSLILEVEDRFEAMHPNKAPV